MGVSGVAGVQMTEGGISGWNDGGESITLRWDQRAMMKPLALICHACTSAQECLLPCLSVTLLSSSVTDSCVRFSFFIWSSLSLSVCEWGLICSQYFVAVSYPPLYFSAFHFHPTEKKLSERERNDRDLIPEFFFIILSALSCVVPSPPVRSVFIYVTRIKDQTGEEVPPLRSSYQGVVV